MGADNRNDLNFLVPRNNATIARLCLESTNDVVCLPLQHANDLPFCFALSFRLDDLDQHLVAMHSSAGRPGWNENILAGFVFRDYKGKAAAILLKQALDFLLAAAFLRRCFMLCLLD